MKPKTPGRYWVTDPNLTIIDGNNRHLACYEFDLRRRGRGFTVHMVGIAGYPDVSLSAVRDDLIWEPVSK